MCKWGEQKGNNKINLSNSKLFLISLISEPAQLKLGFKVWDVFNPEVWIDD